MKTPKQPQRIVDAALTLLKELSETTCDDLCPFQHKKKKIVDLLKDAGVIE